MELLFRKKSSTTIAGSAVNSGRRNDFGAFNSGHVARDFPRVLLAVTRAKRLTCENNRLNVT